MTAQEIPSRDLFPIMGIILIFICVSILCVMLMQTQRDKKINDSFLKCLDREQKVRDIFIKFG